MVTLGSDLSSVEGRLRNERAARVERTEIFDAERARLLGIATRVLADHAEAEDVVQRAWLRLYRTDAAILVGTPDRIEGARAVATFFDGSAHTALSVFAYDRPGAAWFHRGEVKVLFDFNIIGGVVPHHVSRRCRGIDDGRAA